MLLCFRRWQKKPQGGRVFFLAGGPGQSAISLAGKVFPLFARLNQNRDIVFVDQRGTGLSAPLQCKNSIKSLALANTTLDAQVKTIRECKEQLRELPYADLRYFSTTLAMQDLDAVRQALGYSNIDLFGGSYGTRAALEYLRLYAARVGRVVIDGVAPPDMMLPTTSNDDANSALEKIWAACTSDADCQRFYPNSGQVWGNLLASLPKTVNVKNPLSQQIESVQITSDLLHTWVRQPLYGPSIAVGLPHAVSEASNGRWEAMLALASGLGADKSSAPAMGMHFSVVCSEDYGLMLKTSVPVGQGLELMYRQVCKDWPQAVIDPSFYTISPSAAPVLVLSGGWDPVTPPRHGQRIALALGSKALHWVAPNLSHGVSSRGCAPDLLFKFLQTKNLDAQAIDASCLTKIPAPSFYIPVVKRNEYSMRATQK